MSAGTSNGGKPEKKDLDYCPPVGPKQGGNSPGLGGGNYGNAPTQGRH